MNPSYSYIMAESKKALQQMASSSNTPPLLSSSPSSIADLHQWLPHFSSTFQNHLSHNTTLPLCIFQLPHTLTSEKPDAYVPKHVGLGPIHHFRPDLYPKQQQLKIITSKTILERYTFTSKFEKFVHERLVDLAGVARYCYDLYFDCDDETLAWILAVDGLFLVDVLIKAEYELPFDAMKDVVMLENQIPFVIFVELMNSLDEQENGGLDASNFLFKFCEARLPLKFDTPITQLDLDINRRFHLLDCIYRLIVNHNLPPHNAFLRTQDVMIEILDLADVEIVVQMAGGLFPVLNVFLQPILVVLKLPWDKIGNFFTKMFGKNQTKPKIDIPSATKLARIGKIEFCTNHGGIHDIEFDLEKLTFSLPVLDLKPDSEVLLRNLIAYEGLMYEKGNIMNLYLTEYVDLMCGIVNGIKDLKILQLKKIIVGDLKDEEIVKMLNGISKSSAKAKKESELQKTVTKVNNYFGDIWTVKVYRFGKKVFLASWKIFASVFSVLSLALMVVFSVCEVYECKGHFGLGNVRSTFAYATGYKQLVEF